MLGEQELPPEAINFRAESENVSETPEPDPELAYIPELGELFGIGDQAFVTRTSGQIETDWTIQSFGEKSVVVMKGSLQKVIPRSTFIEQQKPFLRMARRPTPIQRKRQAHRLGIDVSQPGWEARIEAEARKTMGE